MFRMNPETYFGSRRANKIFFCYGLSGKHLPGILRHSGFSLVEITDQLYLTTEGVFGVPIQVSAGVIVLFIIFAAFVMSES